MNDADMMPVADLPEPREGRGSADLTWDTLRPEDAEQLQALFGDIADADGTGETMPLEAARDQLSLPGFDLARDSLAVRDAGRLIATASVDVATHPDREGRARVRLEGGVHPHYRRRGIGGRLLDRQQEMGRRLAEAVHPGRPGHLHVGGGLDGADVRPLLTARGFEQVRTFQEMLRPLPDESLPEPARIDGLELVTPGEGESAAVHAAHVEAFADHWGSAPASADRWARLWQASTRRPEFSTIARDADGIVQGYVITEVWQPRRLYIGLVGTRPGARGRGVATATLTRTLRLATRSGEFDDVELEVDGESLTGATRLYGRLGFILDKSFALYSKELS
ncbi:GNAT family N-acetyltransferase [Brachybacterium endophyticum]|uniref:GNAT family N-acetyltransferase n=1 Tax=Brachybacterium endophyticum TaxID=2182385 RepID=UPI0014030257|nr:GNAT family N-acetyltransferase [Brachybacterium endophyticum]